ncbi:MAG: formate dehydrogenase accessory sulfurtransferase FdhD [Acidobacteriota bacterium]
MTNPLEAGLAEVRVDRSGVPEPDWVAVEEPLEIRLDDEPLVVTMRTPGQDRELAAGFLWSEGIVTDLRHIEAIEPCVDPMAYDPDNVVFVRLSETARCNAEQISQARRDFTAVAACGLCGKARLEDVYQRLPEIPPLECSIDFLRRLPERMRPEQNLFDRTGGIHAAALFDVDGRLLAVAEDIGRHNAVDKLIGRSLLADELPWHDRIVIVSARAGFEIVQKALMAGAPVLGSVGAASSLAVSLAKQGGMALYSFLGPRHGHRYV